MSFQCASSKLEHRIQDSRSMGRCGASPMSLPILISLWDSYHLTEGLFSKYHIPQPNPTLPGILGVHSEGRSGQELFPQTTQANLYHHFLGKSSQSQVHRGRVPGDTLLGTCSRQEMVTEGYHKSNGKDALPPRAFHLPGSVWLKQLPDKERKVVTIWRLTEYSRHTKFTSPGIWQSETQQPFPPVYSPCRKGQSPNEEKVWDEKDKSWFVVFWPIKQEISKYQWVIYPFSFLIPYKQGRQSKARLGATLP